MLGTPTMDPLKHLLARDAFARFDLGETCLDLLARPFFVAFLEGGGIPAVRHTQGKGPGREEYPLNGIAHGEIRLPQQFFRNLYGNRVADASNLSGHDLSPL